MITGLGFPWLVLLMGRKLSVEINLSSEEVDLTSSGSVNFTSVGLLVSPSDIVGLNGKGY